MAKEVGSENKNTRYCAVIEGDKSPVVSMQGDNFVFYSEEKHCGHFHTTKQAALKCAAKQGTQWVVHTALGLRAN